MHATRQAELWLPISGYCGNYEASNLGRIRSVDRMERVGKYMRSRKGRVLKPTPNKDGYLAVFLRSPERVGPRLVHQLVAEAFHGPRPSPDLQCCHNNGISTDNRAENLRWDTAKENQRDRNRHGQVYVNRFTRRDHCKYGHPFGPASTRIDKRRWRVCRVCAAARSLIDCEAVARRISYAEMAKVLPMPEAIKRVEARLAKSSRPPAEGVIA